MQAHMHSLKEQHSSPPKHEAGFPFSQIYEKKQVIFLPFFLLKNISFAKKSTYETPIPIKKVVNSLTSRKATPSVNHQVISSLQLASEFDTNEKIPIL